MEAKMKMKDALELIKFELLAQEAGAVKQVPTLAGRPGIGKTESLKALAQQLGYELIPVQLSAVAPEEFSGIPDFQDAPEEFSKKYSNIGVYGAKFTKWSVPELVAHANAKAELIKSKGGKGVVILLDDIHAADPALERYMFNLFLDKTVGQYRLADNVLLVAAMNDSEEAGFSGFNAAVMDRLAVYPVEFDFDTWYKIIGGKLDPMIATFLKNHQEYIIGDESTEEVTPSPRSWTELSNLIKYIKENKKSKIDNAMLRYAAVARVGDKAAAELVKFNIVYQKFNFENILSQKPENVEVPEDFVEQIIFASIVRYVKSKTDAEKLIKLIELNKTKKIFVSSFVSELAVMLNSKNKNAGIEELFKWVVSVEDKEIADSFYDAFGI